MLEPVPHRHVVLLAWRHPGFSADVGESWARLIARVFQADPLVCKRGGGSLKVVAHITDELSIKRILDHLGLSPPEPEKPPPAREVVRVPVDDEGREVQAP